MAMPHLLGLLLQPRGGRKLAGPETLLKLSHLHLQLSVLLQKLLLLLQINSKGMGLLPWAPGKHAQVSPFGHLIT